MGVLVFIAIRRGQVFPPGYAADGGRVGAVSVMIIFFICHHNTGERRQQAVRTASG